MPPLPLKPPTNGPSACLHWSRAERFAPSAKRRSRTKPRAWFPVGRMDGSISVSVSAAGIVGQLLAIDLAFSCPGAPGPSLLKRNFVGGVVPVQPCHGQTRLRGWRRLRGPSPVRSNDAGGALGGVLRGGGSSDP